MEREGGTSSKNSTLDVESAGEEKREEESENILCVKYDEIDSAEEGDREGEGTSDWMNIIVVIIIIIIIIIIIRST